MAADDRDRSWRVLADLFAAKDKPPAFRLSELLSPHRPVPPTTPSLFRPQRPAPIERPPRTFVGFSSTDHWRYIQMKGWNAIDGIELKFADCQLDTAMRSDDERYIKAVCRQHLKRAGTFVQLIGHDTRHKHKYVRWEAEVAVDKECRIICVNLDGSWKMNPATCPPLLRDAGAVFVPFSARIIGHALRDFKRETSGAWIYPQTLYNRLGYVVVGGSVIYIPKPKPWLSR